MSDGGLVVMSFILAAVGGVLIVYAGLTLLLREPKLALGMTLLSAACWVFLAWVLGELAR